MHCLAVSWHIGHFKPGGEAVKPGGVRTGGTELGNMGYYVIITRTGTRVLGLGVQGHGIAQLSIQVSPTL